MNKRMYIGQFRHLFDKLALSVSGARKNAGRQIIILTGSATLASWLKRRLAEESENLWNVKFVTFPRLAQYILRNNPGNEAPLPGLGDYLLVRDIVKEHGGYFKQVAGLPGFARTTAESIRDLKEACVAPTSLKKISGNKMKSFAAIYAEYEARLKKHALADRSAYLAAAADAAKNSAALRDAHFICYGIYDMNGAQRRLFASAADAAASAEIFVPSGDAPAFDFAKPFGEWLAAKKFTAQKIAGENGLAEKLFAATPSAAGGNFPALSIISAPGEYAEARQIVREAAKLAGDGTPFDEIAVLTRSSLKYRKLLRDEFARAGIPCTAAGEQALSATPHGAALIMLASLLSGESDRKALMQFINYAPLDFEKILGAKPGLPALELISREAGAFARDTELLKALKKMSRSADDARKEHIGHLVKFIETILAARRAMPQSGTWTKIAAALAEQYRALMLAGEGAEQVVEIIDSLAAFDALGVPATLDDALATAVELLDKKSPPAKKTGGVFIGDLLDSRGLAFQCVILPGMAERIFPAAAQQDPILLDRERVELRQKVSGDSYLPLKGERAREEKILFALAVSAAEKQLILTYPRIETSSAREVVPSHFLLRLVEAYTGAQCDYTALEKFAGFRHTALLPEDSAPADLPDYDIARIAKHVSQANANEAIYLAKLHGGFRAGLATERARWHSRNFTQYDGAVGPLENHEPLSVSRIEKYAACPFAYFAKYVLGLNELEEEDPLRGMTARDYGSLFHRIVAAAYEEMFDGGKTADSKQLQDALERAAEREFANCTGTGPRLTWEATKRKMLRDLRKLAVLDDKRRRADSAEPMMFEAAFGMPRATHPMLKLDIAGKTYSFRGVIDRIDSVEGKVRIIDYKTGKVDCKDDCFTGGRDIQLPIYIFAAEKITGREALSAEYWMTTVKNKFASRSFSKEALGARRADLEKIIAITDDLISKGIFIAVPSDKGCLFCDSAALCPANIDLIFGRKKDDAQISNYLEMQKIE